MSKDRYNIVIIGTDGGNWVVGTIGGCDFQAKVYIEPSVYGINKGNVSKLYIKDFANYDRGWDVKPKTQCQKEIVKQLVEFLKEHNPIIHNFN